MDVTQNKRLQQLDFLRGIAILLVLITLIPLGIRPAIIVMISIPLSLAIGLTMLDLAGFGINAETAKSIGAALIPVVLGKLANKTNDPNDSSFNLQDMLGKLAGGADGKFDLTDVMGMFNGGQNQANGQQGEGGIMDKLKGLF